MPPCPHFDLKIVQRSKRQSAVAAAAYQSGERLFSEYDQKQKYYSHKSEIVHTEIMLPPHAPPEYADRNTLWNAAEAIEKQWNSQLARRLVLAIPRDIPPAQQADLIRDFCREFFVSKGMIADFAIHDKGDGNPHAHISLAVDIQAKLAAGKGPGYERWAKVFNIKQMAAALAYIQDNGLTDYEQLAQKATEATDHFHVLSEQIKHTEQAMKTNAGLKAATVQYAKTRPVFEQYKAAKYSRKFLAEHEADIELYRAAQAEMRRLLGGAKLPKMDALKEESRKLTAKKKRLYGEYQKARRDMQEIVTIKANIDTLLGYTEPGRKQEKER